MEGQAALFKTFADIDAWPIGLNPQEVDELVRAVQLLAPGFGGINLEAPSVPRCFEVERRLRALLDIPVFHADQHGTAIVVHAALLNLPGRETKIGSPGGAANLGAAGVDAPHVAALPPQGPHEQTG